MLLYHKFVGFSSEIKKKEERKKKGIFKDVVPHDIVKFGLIPEFTGRLPVITAMKDLSEDDLVRVLTEPKNSLVKQYRKLLSMDGVELSFKPEALRLLAKAALKRKTGARGLRAEMERLMTDVMYEAPGNDEMKKVVITAKTIKERLGIDETDIA